MFADPSHHGVGMSWVNFKIEFSLFRLNKVPRSAEKSHVSQPQPLTGCRWDARSEFRKYILLEIE